MANRHLLVGLIAVIGCSSQPATALSSRAATARNSRAAVTSLAESAAAAPRALTDLGARRAGSDWPRFLGPTGDGISTETGIVTPWPAAGLKVVWQRQVGTGYCVPSVSKGRLFLFDRHGDNARLSCWKSETAEPLWQFDYPTHYEDRYGYNNGPRCCPVVDDDRVYIHGVEGMLHCLSADDGKPRWRVDTFADFGVVPNFFGVGSTPVVEGDLLIVQVGGSPPTDKNAPFPEQTGNGSGVVAFDKWTGKIRYKITDELASFSSPVLTTIDGRRWCFVLARGGLIGFEPSTGKVDFHYDWRARELESVNAANPVVVGNRVLITEAYGPGSSFLQVRPGAYDVLWNDADKGRRKSLQSHWTTPIHHNGYVYGDSSRHPENADIRCVELATGKVMWREPDNGHTSLLMVDGHFVVLTEFGELILIKVNPQKYEEISRFDLFRLVEGAPKERSRAAQREAPWWAAPILSHGLLYVRSKNTLMCLELIPTK